MYFLIDVAGFHLSNATSAEILSFKDKLKLTAVSQMQKSIAVSQSETNLTCPFTVDAYFTSNVSAAMTGNPQTKSISHVSGGVDGSVCLQLINGQ